MTKHSLSTAKLVTGCRQHLFAFDGDSQLNSLACHNNRVLLLRSAPVKGSGLSLYVVMSYWWLDSPKHIICQLGIPPVQNWMGSRSIDTTNLSKTWNVFNGLSISMVRVSNSCLPSDLLLFSWAQCNMASLLHLSGATTEKPPFSDTSTSTCNNWKVQWNIITSTFDSMKTSQDSTNSTHFSWQIRWPVVPMLCHFPIFSLTRIPPFYRCLLPPSPPSERRPPPAPGGCSKPPRWAPTRRPRPGRSLCCFLWVQSFAVA